MKIISHLSDGPNAPEFIKGKWAPVEETVSSEFQLMLRVAQIVDMYRDEKVNDISRLARLEITFD